MKRRGFFGALFGALGLGAVKTEAQEGPRIATDFNWWSHSVVPEPEGGWMVAWNSDDAWKLSERSSNDDGWTDNPEWRGRIPFGKEKNEVLIDGVVVNDLPITSLKTGSNGWVSYLAKTRDGKLMYNSAGDAVLRFRRHGNVEYFPKIT